MPFTHRRRAGLLSLSLSLSVALVPAGALAGTGAAAPAPAAAARAATAPARLDPALGRGSSAAVRLVVRLAAGQHGGPERAVRRLGGRVTAELPLVDGFAATLPRRALPALAATEGVAVLSEDHRVTVQGGASTGSGGPLAPQVVRAPGAWSAGYTGQGVTVALLDTGVADLPDLAGRIAPVRDQITGQVAACYDLSGEGSCRDSYGHGTFMAGLIAGNGSSGAGGPTGTAPGARILSVKVAGADGAADVSTVLAGLQWVVSFRDTYGIRVLNLSLGTDSTQSWQEDPLNYAVERAWAAGITVVVAASNRGPAPGTIAKPGDDPYVVTVGAVDDRGTVGSGDDEAPDFSSRGPTAEGVAKPDVVAPGAHELSLRSPGSTLDAQFPPADLASPYRRGSGTSMAAAVVSGVAAVALSAHPDLTPDRLKLALRAAGRRVASRDPSVVGSGLVDAYSTALSPAAGAANLGLAHGTGLGALGASRGSLLMATDDPASTLMTGRETAQLLLWDPLSYATGSWTPTTWYTSANATVGWNTASWYDGDFNGHNWTGHNWTGSSWYSEHEDGTSYGRHGAGSASYGAWD